MTDVRTSYAEELLYGQYAPLVKLLGQAAVSVTLLGNQIGGMLTGSREADQITGPSSVAKPPEAFEGWDGDRSPHTQWLEAIYKELYPLIEATVKANRKLAADCVAQFTAQRDAVHSLQAAPPELADRGWQVSSGGVPPDAS